MGDKNIFRGRLAIGLFCSVMSLAVAQTTMISIGGTPLEQRDGHYFLNNHGESEVTHAIWILAHVCEKTLIIGWILTLVLILALIVRKALFFTEVDRRKNYSILVLFGFIMIVLLPIIVTMFTAWFR